MNYENLLNKAGQEFDSFSLVWRSGLKFNKNAKFIERELEEFLTKEQRTRKWPGTEIFKGQAIVRYYKLTPLSLAVLRRVNSVSEWLAPNYPEDLAFYLKGNAVYASVAHENDQWFINNA